MSGLHHHPTPDHTLPRHQPHSAVQLHGAGHSQQAALSQQELQLEEVIAEIIKVVKTQKIMTLAAPALVRSRYRSGDAGAYQLLIHIKLMRCDR